MYTLFLLEEHIECATIAAESRIGMIKWEDGSCLIRFMRLRSQIKLIIMRMHLMLLTVHFKISKVANVTFPYILLLLYIYKPQI